MRCRISVDPEAFRYSTAQPGVPRHNVAARLTDNTSDGRRARSCSTRIELTCSADIPTFGAETTLSVSVLLGLVQRPSPVTDAVFSDIVSRFQSFGTVMTFGGAAVAGAADGETVGMAAGTGVAGSGDGVAGACRTSTATRNACARIILSPTCLSRRATFAFLLLTAMAAGCTPVVPAGAPAPAAPAEREAAYLYVGNSQGSLSTLTVYPLHGSKPLRVVRRTWGVNGMAVDPFGYVYTGNGLPTYGEITVYNPGGGSILLNIYSGDVRVFAFDAKGDVYVSDNGFISQYASHSDRVIRSIGPHTYNVDALAVAGSGDLYAAQLGNTSSGVGPGVVKVFPPKKTRASRTIRNGIDTPVALAFDASGNLYVANCPSCYAKQGTGSVAEYAPGAGVPSRVLRDGIDNPDALVSGNDGLLVVANNPSLSYGVTKPGWISVYSSTGKSPQHRITRGTKSVDSLAIDADGYVYAESYGKHSDVAVVARDGSRVIRTITDGVVLPNRIAVGY